MGVSNKEKESVIKRCIDYFIENSTFDKNGKISTALSIEYYAAIELLNAYIPNEAQIPESTIRIVIRKTMNRFLRYKKYSENPYPVRAFYEAFDIELNRIQKKRTSYFVAMFLNLDYQSTKMFKDISIIDDSIEFISWGKFSEFDVENLWKQLDFENQSNVILLKDDDYSFPDRLTFTPVIIEISNSNIKAAIDLASEKIDLLRAFINTSFSLLQYTYFRSKPKELSKILPTPIYAVFNEQKGFQKIFYSLEEYSYSNVKIPQDRIEIIDHLFDIYSKQRIDNDLNSYLISILQHYQKALDMVHPEIAYLAMWRVLEYSISLGDKGINNDKLKSRIKNLIKPNQIQKDIIHLITDQRNSLVHTGIFPDKSDNIYFILKDIVDHIIYRLIILSYHFDSVAELHQYLIFAERGDADLYRTKNVIEKILKNRTE
jgi:hypothetical protein